MKPGDLVCATFDKCYYGIITNITRDLMDGVLTTYGILWTDENKPMVYNEDTIRAHVEIVNESR